MKKYSKYSLVIKKNEKESRHDNISFLPRACYELRIHGREANLIFLVFDKNSYVLEETKSYRMVKVSG